MSYNGVWLDSITDQMRRDSIRMTRAYRGGNDDEQLHIESNMSRLVRRVDEFNGNFESIVRAHWARLR